MRDILPTEVLDRLRNRYVAGIDDAVANYDHSSADEDSLTGALGQAISMRIPELFSTARGNFQIKIDYQKIRGRGKNAPEKRYGSDGLFQIEVLDIFGQSIRKKALPFQSKKNWRGTNSALASQAAKMIVETDGGIVIDFTRGGYFACSAKAVVRADGKRGLAHSAGEIFQLGQLLGTDFLECRIGTVGMFYERATETYQWLLAPAHLITTTIRFQSSRQDQTKQSYAGQ